MEQANKSQNVERTSSRSSGSSSLSSLEEYSASEGLSKRPERLRTRGQTGIEKQYGVLPNRVPRRIYILGTGSIGMLVAHALRSLPSPPPVTLLFHKASLLQAWEAGPRHITIHRDGVDIQQSGFDAELVEGPRIDHDVPVRGEIQGRFAGGPPTHESAKRLTSEQQLERRHLARRTRADGIHVPRDTIDHVIVTTKAYASVAAMLSIKARLRMTSTVCLLQNGMGVIDELNEKVFTDPEQRPKYIQGVISHGANVPPQIAEHDPFFAVHAGAGTIALAVMTPEDTKQRYYARYLLRTLTRSPVLVAATHPPTALLQLQLEKLAVNCIINPLTSLLDARNGAILNNFALSRMMRLMLIEISVVIRKLPELQGLPNVPHRFAVELLEKKCVSTADATADNVSSMLQDVRAGRQTEIEYINGYIVRRGEEIGIKCVVNYGIMNTVMAKSQLIHREQRDEVPLEEPPNFDLRGH